MLPAIGPRGTGSLGAACSGLCSEGAVVGGSLGLLFHQGLPLEYSGHPVSSVLSLGFYVSVCIFEIYSQQFCNVQYTTLNYSLHAVRQVSRQQQNKALSYVVDFFYSLIITSSLLPPLASDYSHSPFCLSLIVSDSVSKWECVLFAFHTWLISLTLVFSTPIYAGTNDRNSLFLKAD